MTEKEMEVKSALIDFKLAYARLVETWAAMPEAPLVDLYPFHQSFDELEVHSWVDNAVSLLNGSGNFEPSIDIRKQKLFAAYQMYYQDDDTKVKIILDEHSEQAIVNPFYSECARFPVNPVEYYGESYTNSDWCKKQFDLTRDQMIEFLASIFANRKKYDEEAIKHLLKTGVIGINNYSEQDLRLELYSQFNIV